MSKQHSQEFKESIIKKIAGPGGPTIMQMSEKTCVYHTSIRNWIKSFGNRSGVTKQKNN
jgi:transposase-like protein